MAFSRLSRLLARTETRVALAAVVLALACIGVGSLIADHLVTGRLLTGAHD